MTNGEGNKMECKNIKSKIIADLILIFVCLALSLSAYFIMRALRDEGASAVIYIDGEKYMECPLDTDGAYSLPGGKNTVTVREGRVFMSYAECPDHRCVKMGEKCYTGESIDCLPNRVRVVVMGAGDGIIGVR